MVCDNLVIILINNLIFKVLILVAITMVDAVICVCSGQKGTSVRVLLTLIRVDVRLVC